MLRPCIKFQVPSISHSLVSEAPKSITCRWTKPNQYAPPPLSQLLQSWGHNENLIFVVISYDFYENSWIILYFVFQAINKRSVYMNDLLLYALSFIFVQCYSNHQEKNLQSKMGNCYLEYNWWYPWNAIIMKHSLPKAPKEGDTRNNYDKTNATYETMCTN